MSFWDDITTATGKTAGKAVASGVDDTAFNEWINSQNGGDPGIRFNHGYGRYKDFSPEYVAAIRQTFDQAVKSGQDPSKLTFQQVWDAGLRPQAEQMLAAQTGGGGLNGLTSDIATSSLPFDVAGSDALKYGAPILLGAGLAGVSAGLAAPLFAGGAAAGAGAAGAGASGMTLAEAGLAGSMIPTGAAGAAITGAAPAFVAPTLGAAGAGAGIGAGTAAASSLIPGISNTALGMGTLGALGVAGNVVGANAQSDAIKDAAATSAAASGQAADATLQGTSESIAAQQKMYDQQRADFKPFLDVAPRSLAGLESSVYDGPQEKFDLAGLAREQTDSLNNFNPKETEAYKWQMDKGLEGLDRTLRMQGRGSGSVATNAALNFAGNLNATEYDKGYSRLSSLNDLNYNRTAGRKTDYQNGLLNLIKTAQGAAGSTSAAGQNFANNSSNAAINQGNSLASIATNNGNNQANAALAAGQTKANLYGGLASVPFQLGSLAIQGGYKPFG